MSDSDDRLVRPQPTEAGSEKGPLALYAGARPAAPAWFERAVAFPARTGYATCEGARIHFRSWGDPSKPGLLMVHGNGAHAHWWDFVAPYLTADNHVVAMTFSGMGDSDWRTSYTMDLFAQEQLAVCEAAGLFRNSTKPIIVAHSFGGFVTVLTGAEFGDRFEGVVIVDSPINPPDRHIDRPPTKRGGRVYPTLEAALARFRLAPPQPCDNHFILDYIARLSLRERPLPDGDGTGWSWKFDPDIWRHFDVRRPSQDLLRETRCRIALFKGAESILWDNDVAEYMRELLNRQVPFIEIPEARHHIMLDQPLAFVAALRTLLQEWRFSAPLRTRWGADDL